MKVIIKPHDPAWVEEFGRVKKDLEVALAGVPLVSIEHVGSTSIPDLLAKPVLDIAILVTEENLEAAGDALVKAGYTALGELGVLHRFAFRQPGYRKEDQAAGSWIEGGEMRRNTYVTLDGCISARNHLDLKRTLLADHELRHEYSNLKKALVDGGVENVDEYCLKKTDIILKILTKAGWSEEDLQVVREANR